MSSVSGQCLCGAVRFTAEKADPNYFACHCGMCRRWSAGPFMSVSSTGVSFDGEENIGVYESSAWAERGFCKNCGSILFYHMKGHDRYELSSGTLEDSSSFKMAGEIFIDHKPQGYEFAGDHPRLTEAETIEKFSSSGA